jgi:hypothetical protein
MKIKNICDLCISEGKGKPILNKIENYENYCSIHENLGKLEGKFRKKVIEDPYHKPNTTYTYNCVYHKYSDIYKKMFD